MRPGTASITACAVVMSLALPGRQVDDDRSAENVGDDVDLGRLSAA